MKKIQGQSFLATEAKERGLFSTFQSNLAIFNRLFPEYKFRISYEGNSLMIRELELAATIFKK